MTKEKKPVVDWDAIELDYRAGIKSLRAMADEYGVSNGRIAQVAKKNQWPRDLQAKIEQKAKEKLSKAALSDELSAAKHVSEAAVVEAGATAIVSVQLGHRRDIQRGHRVVMKLLDELEFQTDNLELLEQLRELMFSPDDKGIDKRDELFRKVISLSSRSSIAKTLTDALKSTIALEREAFGIDGGKNDADTGIESVIKRVMAKNGE